MLVLTVRKDEFVTLFDKDGKEIGKIGIVRVEGERVRIAFNLPKDIVIARPGLEAVIAESITGDKR